MKSGTKILVGLSSVAVLCGSALALAEAKVPLLAHNPSASTQAATHTASTSTSAGNSTTAPQTQTASASTTQSTRTLAKYKDGTYTGVGTTPIGSVQVAVTLQSDRITHVQITGYSTHYPISFIDPVLPQELLARQNINKINVVSGATLSTADFYYAVQSCLQQAHAAAIKAHSVSSHA